MVNVDALNDEIKQFGVVIDRMQDLPPIYEKVQAQLDICRDAANELKIAKEDMDRFMADTTKAIEQNHRETDSKLSEIERNLVQKIDNEETNLKDRVALVESNLALSLTNLTHTIEAANAELNKRMDAEQNESKKRFIIIVVGVCISIVLGIVGLVV